MTGWPIQHMWLWLLSGAVPFLLIDIVRFWNYTKPRGINLIGYWLITAVSALGIGAIFGPFTAPAILIALIIKFYR